MKKSLIFSLFGLIQHVLTLSVDALAINFECKSGTLNGQLAVTTEITHYFVVINEVFLYNTTLNLVGGIVININNAPITFSTTVTGISSSVITSILPGETLAPTVSDPSTPKPPVSTSGPFILILPSINLQPRQITQEYIDNQGLSTSDSALAATFSIIDDQLFSNGGYLSTDTFIDAIPFAFSPNIRAISKTFAIVNEVLRWTNESFPSSRAGFCRKGSSVQVFFNGGASTSCIPVTLRATSVLPTAPFAVSLSVSTPFASSLGSSSSSLSSILNSSGPNTGSSGTSFTTSSSSPVSVPTTTPPPSSRSSTATSTTTTVTVTPSVCSSDSDCSKLKPKCDVASHMCVECVATIDCPGIRPVCNFSTGTCVSCTTDSECTRFNSRGKCNSGSCAVPIQFPFN